MPRKPKALATIKLPYETERRDLVLAEINRELGEARPNWNYLERLKTEFEYWDGRAKLVKISAYSSFIDFSSLFGPCTEEE